MSERDAGQQGDLERLLGSFKDDPALEELEDRAYDAAHLEDEQFDLLLADEPGPDEESIANLKRHVLFCDLCSAEFLRRAAPEAEAEFAEEAADDARRRWLAFTVLVVVLAFGIGLASGLWLGRDGDDRPARGETPKAFAEVVRGGTGAAMGRDDAPGRLFLSLKADSTRDVHAHVFVIAGARVTPLHPMPSSSEENPVPGGVLPAGGWADPGGDGPRELLVLLTAEPIGFGMQQLAARLAALRADGERPQDLQRALDQLRGAREGGTYLIRLEE